MSFFIDFIGFIGFTKVFIGFLLVFIGFYWFIGLADLFFYNFLLFWRFLLVLFRFV